MDVGDGLGVWVSVDVELGLAPSDSVPVGLTETVDVWLMEGVLVCVRVGVADGVGVTVEVTVEGPVADGVADGLVVPDPVLETVSAGVLDADPGEDVKLTVGVTLLLKLTVGVLLLLAPRDKLAVGETEGLAVTLLLAVNDGVELNVPEGALVTEAVLETVVGGVALADHDLVVVGVTVVVMVDVGVGV